MPKHLKAMVASLGLITLSSCAAGLPTQSENTADTPMVTGPGDRMPSGRTHGVRSAVVAPNAAAATAHPLATQVALDVMKQGGNAVDAAIAANAMLGLVEPTGNGIGGDLFAMVYDPKTNRLYGYNGSGRSPMGMTLTDAQAAADKFMDGEEIPPFGSAPVTVPGTVEAWGALHQRFGKRPFNMLMEPTIRYARDGAPIPEVIAYYWQFGPKRFQPAFESGMLEEYANAKKTYFSPAPREGSLFRNPDLANTLERIAYFGPQDFYTGQIARTMDTYFQRIGGKMRFEDFAAHKGEWVEPLCVTYRGDYKLCELPPNTQGVAALQMLQMLERFDLRSMGYGSADSLMAQIEAKRLAFADRARGYADPNFSGMDPSLFIASGYNLARSCLIDLEEPSGIDAGELALNSKISDAYESASKMRRLFSDYQNYCDSVLSTSGFFEDIKTFSDEPLRSADAKLQGGDLTKNPPYSVLGDSNYLNDDFETLEREIEAYDAIKSTFILQLNSLPLYPEPAFTEEKTDLERKKLWLIDRVLELEEETKELEYSLYGMPGTPIPQSQSHAGIFEEKSSNLNANIAAADKKLQDGDTTYLTVTDKDGMMVSLIQSNYRGMGSGLVADGLGFMFQDRGQLFSLDPEHPNVFEPGKRPFHTIIPAFAFKKDMPGCQVRAVPIDQACPFEPWLSFGLMGGGMQPQGHVQIMLNLIDFDMGLQEAGDAARWEHRGGCEPTDDLTGDECEADIGTVHLESGIPEDSRKELERRGHTVVCCSANGGGYQAIMRDFETGAWIAATEMRKDGSADGY